MKSKDFMDKEVTVVNVVESEGKEAELAKFIVRDEFDNTFPVRPAGTFEQRRVWMQNPNLVIGKRYTIKYFSIYPDTNKPRFPTGVAFRDYE
jgi:O6-methylguanine-DNA--protein-cysteine methyltransferase